MLITPSYWMHQKSKINIKKYMIKKLIFNKVIDNPFIDVPSLNDISYFIL